MALIYMDGFDCYADYADLAGSGWVSESTGFAGFNATGGRFGGGALEFNSVVFQFQKAFTTVANGNSIIFAFAYKHAGAGAPNPWLRVVSDANLTIGTITHDTSGDVTWTPSIGSATSSTGTPLTSGTWHWVEIKITLGTTASNGACEIRIDGSTVVNATSQDTNVTGTGAAYFEITGGGSSNPNEAYFDDFIIMDSTGSNMNDFIGDSGITVQTPNADGGVVAWTASAGADYECVDESPAAANGDTDYISSSTAGQESRFNLTNLSGTPTTIHAVQVRYKAKKTGSGQRTLRGLINSNANESTGSELGLTTAYVWHYGGAYPLDPDGSVAWTISAVNALQAGVEVVS